MFEANEDKVGEYYHLATSCVFAPLGEKYL